MLSIYHNDNFRTNCKPELLAFHLNEMFPHVCTGVVTICEGRHRYNISARTAKELAIEFISFGGTDVSILGESHHIEDANDFITFFRKVNTELVIFDGAIRSVASTYETAFRK